MNFSVSRDHGAFEWAGANFDTIFCQFRNFFSPRMWRMLFDIVRFNYFALDFLDEEPVTYVNNAQESMGDYLRRNGYSDAFRDDYLVPMTAAVWTAKSDKCTLDFPAAALIRFLFVPCFSRSLSFFFPSTLLILPPAQMEPSSLVHVRAPA